MGKSIKFFGLCLLLGLTCLHLPNHLSAQLCTNTALGSQSGCARSTTSITTEIAPSGGTTPVSVSPYSPGSYFRIPVLAGGCYTIGTCGAPFDTQISCFQGSATSGPFAYDDDSGPLCPGTPASCSMVPSFTGYANIDVRSYPCLDGGSSSITVTVQQNNNLSITSSNASMCQGQVRTLSGLPVPVTGQMPNSGAPGTFSGTGVSGQTFTAPTPSAANQNYTITYTFGYISVNQTIQVFHAPTVANAGPDQTVCSSSATLAGNPATFGTGQWTISGAGTATITSPTSPTTSVTGLVPGGSVTLKWTISNGVCASTQDSVVISRTQDPTPANAGGNMAICADSISLNANSPLVGSGSWSVAGGSGAIINPNSSSTAAVNLSLGNNAFVWSIANGVCPPSRDTIFITRDAEPTQPVAGPDKQICDAQTTMSANIPATGTGTWYQVSGSGFVVTPASPNTTVNAINIGSSAFRWAITNGTCPTKNDTIIITRNALPNAPTIGGSQTVCIGSSATLTALSNAASPTFLWWDSLSGGNLLAVGSTYTTPPLTSAITVYVEVNDGFTTCSSTRTQFTVNVAPLPTVSLGPDQQFCSSDSVCLNGGSGMASYQWNTGSTAQIICTHNSGTYWVEITDVNGCTATDTIILTATPSPIVNLGPNFTLCTGNSNTIGVAQINGQTYDWSNGLNSNTIVVTTGGTYSLTVTDPNGCSDVDTVVATQRNPPIAAFTMNTANCPNIEFTDQSTDATSWTWSFGNGNSSQVQNSNNTYAANGTYTVTLISTGPCGSDTTQQQLPISCIVGTVVPNNLAITVYPNPNDGVFKIHFDGLDQTCVLTIVNQLGQKVYTREIEGCGGTCDQIVEMGNVAAGLYHAQMKIGDISVTKQIIVR